MEHVTMPGQAVRDRQVKRYGWRPDLPDPRDRSFNAEEPVAREEQLPPKFSLREQMPQVFNQLQLGSCVPNGAVAALMAMGMKQGEAELMLSRLFVYYYGRKAEGTLGEDSGMQVRDAIKILAAMGAPPETDWPYHILSYNVVPAAAAQHDAAAHKALKYQRINPLGPGAPLRTALFSGRPIVKGFSVPEYFEDPTWNQAAQALRMPTPSDGFIGGHCTVTIGWDFTCTRFPVPVFEERNSWGAGWGDGGHFWMDARWLWNPQLSSDFWTVTLAE